MADYDDTNPPYEGSSRQAAYSYRTFFDGRRAAGIASTTRHSAIIAIPINSNANASTGNLPHYETVRLVRGALTRC